MSHSVPAEEYDPPSARSNNNSAPRSSQNKPQLLDAMMRNVPKLKELNYTHWNNMITNSIKKSKLWGYVDGTIQEPSDHDAGNLATYYDEIAAVRNAILGSLEPGAQRYIEDTLDARDAWLALEKKYLTAEAETDAELLATEKRLADMRLEEDDDMVEHIAEFCRMRCRLNGTRFALDDQACISMLYRSLPSSYRQSALTAEKTEMKDFGALCARLSDLSQNPQPQTIPDDAPEDYTSWGVPKDVKAFELTGSKNPLLAERATVTCRDCLLKDHKAGTPDCPQYEWRKELWGTESNDDSVKAHDLGNDASAERPAQVNTKRLSYEFSEPVKVVLSFNELGLKPGLMSQLTRNFPRGEGFVVSCQDSAKLKIAVNRWGASYQNYYLHGSMKPEEYRSTAKNFASKLAGIRYKNANQYTYDSYDDDIDPVSRVLLVTTNETLPITDLSNIATPLINYDVPKDIEDYIRWLDHWRAIDPSQSQTIITLVTAETDEIHIIQNLVQFYGVHITELLWRKGGIH
ncbi:unnamed protein product [Rhizoctonia solani]|uniref:Uncharacterized protein n=1 Tax=Rhizoctonia solani TaxID=456999 RepID=A0A8H2WB94_9AGAM|nr:unnamed protein product [Rhizoctonia solani]